jgi:hypothetical protein
MAKETILMNTKHYLLESINGGHAYRLSHKLALKEVFVTGDNAGVFMANLSRFSNDAPGASLEALLHEMWRLYTHEATHSRLDKNGEFRVRTR